MSGKTFIDTNVLIYAHDADAGAKHQIAKEVLRELWTERTGVLSVQVLREFYVNVTRKISTPVSKELARLGPLCLCKRINSARTLSLVDACANMTSAAAQNASPLVSQHQ
jgi:predicted nucleic acid-binding protein